MSERVSAGLGLRMWRGLECFNRSPLSHCAGLKNEPASQVDFVGSTLVPKNCRMKNNTHDIRTYEPNILCPVFKG